MAGFALGYSVTRGSLQGQQSKHIFCLQLRLIVFNKKSPAGEGRAWLNNTNKQKESHCFTDWWQLRSVRFVVSQLFNQFVINTEKQEWSSPLSDK